MKVLWKIESLKLRHLEHSNQQYLDTYFKVCAMFWVMRLTASFKIKVLNGFLASSLSEVWFGLCVLVFPVVWMLEVTVNSFLEQEHVWPLQPVSTAPGDCHHMHILWREDDVMSSFKPVIFYMGLVSARWPLFMQKGTHQIKCVICDCSGWSGKLCWLGRQ